VDDTKERTVKDIYDAMTDEQKDAVSVLICQAINDERRRYLIRERQKGV